MDLKIAQYNTRISELRGKGMLIENKTKIVDGSKHSWFRYIPIVVEKTGQSNFLNSALS